MHPTLLTMVREKSEPWTQNQKTFYHQRFPEAIKFLWKPTFARESTLTRLADLISLILKKCSNLWSRICGSFKTSN